MTHVKKIIDKKKKKIVEELLGFSVDEWSAEQIELEFFRLMEITP